MGNAGSAQPASIEQCCGARPKGAERLEEGEGAEKLPAGNVKSLRPDEVNLLREVYALGKSGDAVELGRLLRKRSDVRDILGLGHASTRGTGKDHLSLEVTALAKGSGSVAWPDLVAYFDARKERQELIQGRETPM